jgi:hypothetical protein
MNLQGTTELAPVPLPAAVGLFVTGLFALAAILGLDRRKRDRLLMSFS